jgi:hypothetical protein
VRKVRHRLVTTLVRTGETQHRPHHGAPRALARRNRRKEAHTGFEPVPPP